MADRDFVSRLQRALELLREASERDTCSRCGCLHSTVLMLEDIGADKRASVPGLKEEIAAAREKLRSTDYDCRECGNCVPMEALKIITGLTARA